LRTALASIVRESNVIRISLALILAMAASVDANAGGLVADGVRPDDASSVRSTPSGVTAGLSTIGGNGPANPAVDADGIHLSGFETIEPAGLDGITSAHNSTRVALRLEPLTWSASLAASAQAWANQCVDLQAPIGLIDYNVDRSVGFPWYVGESITASPGGISPDAAVTVWEQQAQNYNYFNNTCSGVCSGYTQLVWATTLQVGCGISNCPNLLGSTSVVCDYGPGGNTGGRPY